MARSDRVGLIIIIIGAVAIAAMASYGALLRVIEVLTGSAVPVLAPFAGESVELPIGPGGSPIAVEVSEAVILATDLAPATVFSLIAAPIVTLIATILVIGCIVVFCRNLLRGVAFSRTNTRLVLTASMIIAVGWALSTLFTNMSVNGAFAAISEQTYVNVLFSADFTPLLVSLVLSAVALAFQSGERLQRDTEGLV